MEDREIDTSQIDTSSLRLWARTVLTRFQQEAKGVAGQEAAALLNTHAAEIADSIVRMVEDGLRQLAADPPDSEVELTAGPAPSVVINRYTGPMVSREVVVGEVLVRHEAPDVDTLAELVARFETRAEGDS